MSDRERLDRALEDLLAGRSPRTEAEELDPEGQRMLRVAQLLRGSSGQEPDQEFVASLHGRLFPQPRRVSRRAAFLGALGGLAAGVLGGVGLEQLARREGGQQPNTALVGRNGKWVRVATVAELPHGTVKPFTAGHIQGFLLNRQGEIRAVSGICTHMGCRLEFERREQALVCPCHGAEFSLTGKPRYGPKGYGVPLPPLPSIKVRTSNDAIEVWSV